MTTTTSARKKGPPCVVKGWARCKLGIFRHMDTSSGNGNSSNNNNKEEAQAHHQHHHHQRMYHKY